MNGLGLHILKCPTGKYTFVGTVPACLLRWVKAEKADIMGQRSVTAPDGTEIAHRSMLFDTAQDARDFAANKGYEVSQ